MKKSFLLITVLVLLLSCHSEKRKLILKSSTGRVNSLLVVIKNSQWDSKVGKTLKDLTQVPVPGLTQPENQFRITQISPDKFNDLFENNRNILIIGLASKNTFKVVSNKYAEPQKIITVTGKTESELIKQIQQHYKDIKQIFNKSDLSLYQQKLANKTWDTKLFIVLNKYTITLPKKYRIVENSKDILWLRKHLAGDASINILAYTIPIPANKLNQAVILSNRDSIGKKFVPGQILNSFMQTSYEIEPTFRPYIINGTEAYEIRGIWEVKNDFMGGAFINYSFVDTKNNTVLCLDGFVYAPNQDKRDYIFELEAIFKTLKVK